MNTKILFITLLAIQSSYTFCADSANEQSQLVKSNEPGYAQLDRVLQPGPAIYGAVIGGAFSSGFASLFSNYCIYSCPLNTTTTSFGVILGNGIIGTSMFVIGGAVVGAVSVGTAILAHRYLKNCYGSPRQAEQNIA